MTIADPFYAVTGAALVLLSGFGALLGRAEGFPIMLIAGCYGAIALSLGVVLT